MFKKILIANRGEIAVRILRACKELGIRTVAVHSTADSDAMHVRLADESVCIGKPASQSSYLNMASILSAAEVTNADAIHPGYGFLSENASFARMVQSHGFHFIGPSGDHIEVMGDKIKAKITAQELGLQVVQGSCGNIESFEKARILAKNIGYPVLLKARAGGGGKGMRRVFFEHDLERSLAEAQQEARASFGNAEVYMEKYLAHPRHIEFQVLGDQYGNVVCLGDRECSIQRNHQKLWEEAPSPALTTEERMIMMDCVVRAMKKFGYVNAGTLEFLYEQGNFYFIEMNTRVQVEHTVTEMITGVDIVKQQILIASGERLQISQEDVVLSGHAIECRVNAEDPKTFAPSPGKIITNQPPGGPSVRVDSALFAGYVVPPHYDSMISKLITHSPTRKECIAKMNSALNEYVIDGIKTNIPLHQALCQHVDIQNGHYDIKWLEEKFLPLYKHET